jgi:hypothetical protein
MIKIERDVPLPPPVRRGRKPTWPFAEMEVGDSFVVPASRREKARLAAANYAHRHRGWKYATRDVPDGYRIWRTA